MSLVCVCVCGGGGGKGTQTMTFLIVEIKGAICVGLLQYYYSHISVMYRSTSVLLFTHVVL